MNFWPFLRPGKTWQHDLSPRWCQLAGVQQGLFRYGLYMPESPLQFDFDIEERIICYYLHLTASQLESSYVSCLNPTGCLVWDYVCEDVTYP